MGEAISLNNGEQLQLRDGTGRLLGVFLSPTTLEQINAERQGLAKEAEELRKQLDEAKRQVALLEQDWHSMFRLLPKELQVTEKDMREALQNSMPLDKLIQELEQMRSPLERDAMTDPTKTPYGVTCIGQSKEQLKALMAQAIRLGKREDLLSAAKAIALELTTDPLQWGDPLYHYRHLELVYCRGVHVPLYVLYAVDERRKLVYVTQFRPLPGHGYREEET